MSNEKIDEADADSEKVFWGDKKVPGWILIIILGALILLILSFHFYFGQPFKIFPKDYLSFEHTIITDGDIESLIGRYNTGDFVDRISMRNDPYFRALKDHDLITMRDTTH